uniref:WG repeat-containing protein n=1 Tax=Alistipes sp. TaxID=1872444 RepID=UPI004055D0D9
MHTLTQYLTTLENPHGLVRTLEGFSLLRREDGTPVFHVGNSAVVFPIVWRGRRYALRCYLRPAPPHLEEIYPQRVLSKELYLYTSPEDGEWVDVVLCDWIKGCSLTRALQEAVAQGDRGALLRLSRAFDRLAAELSVDAWAHGDIKPENIVVDEQLNLHLIDRDGLFLPAFAGELSPEVGTPAWQHPQRSVKDFDRYIDHYALAMLSVQLRALALDPSLLVRYSPCEALIFSSSELFGQKTPLAFEEVLSIFARQGLAKHYRLALALRKSLPLLDTIEALLSSFASSIPLPEGVYPEFYMEWGLCGYRSAAGVVIPPVYDAAFDFREGYAVVRFGGEFHLINRHGESVWHLEKVDGLKSVRQGKIRYHDLEGWHECDVPKLR